MLYTLKYSHNDKIFVKEVYSSSEYEVAKQHAINWCNSNGYVFKRFEVK